MNLFKKAAIALIFVLFIAFSLIPIASANSAAPPALTIIVDFPPKDLSLSIRFDDGSTVEADLRIGNQRTGTAFYRFYHGFPTSAKPSQNGGTLVAQSNEINLEYPLPPNIFSTSNNLITLNMKTGTVTEGQPLSRSVLLISMRVSLTLLIEGLIFLAFGYRKRASWITFFIVNLITQGILNIILNIPFAPDFGLAILILCEVLVFVAEALSFSQILKEHTGGRAVAYALTANFASLILGGLLITYLPA